MIKTNIIKKNTLKHQIDKQNTFRNHISCKRNECNFFQRIFTVIRFQGFPYSSIKIIMNKKRIGYFNQSTYLRAK